MLIPVVLLATATIVLGAQAPRPGGFVAIALAVVSITSAALHWPR